MKYVWKDLPEKKNCFTVRNAAMINLNTGEIVQHYSANTKIVVAQKCITPDGTYYRTERAAYNYLNYAFKASAFGLPNEKAPSEPSSTSTISHPKPSKLASRSKKPVKKHKSVQKVALPKGGEVRRLRGWWRNIFRRKNG